MILILPAALWLAWQNHAVRSWLLHAWLVRLIVIYAILHFGLSIWAYRHQEVNRTALLYGLIINLRFFYFFCLCATVAASHNFLKNNWAKLLLIPALAVVCIGLVQKFLLPSDFLKHFGYGPATIPAYQTVDANVDYTRLQSTLRGANPLGAYLILIIPAIFLKLKRKSYWLMAAFIGTLIVLFYTYSRSAIVGTGLTLASLAWLSMKRPPKKWLLAGVLLLLIIPSLYFGFRSNQTIQKVFLHTSTTSTSSASSNRVRDVAIQNALLDIREDPIGLGPGTAGPASFRNYGHRARIAENYYLQLGQEIGILGIIIFLSINLLVAYELWLMRDKSLPLILLASLIGISFVNLVSHAWADDTLSLLWWGLAGIALAPAIIKDKHNQNNVPKAQTKSQNRRPVR